MQRLMFYCQHILGIGHIVRSMEIVRGLMKDFQICFINGGEIIEGFQIPDGIEVINIPAIKTDSEFKQLFVPEGFQTVDQALEHRRDLLLQAVQKFQPDVLVVELFPFGRRRFSSELIPFIESARFIGSKVVCSLRDIVVTKQDRTRHEDKICRLMNQYFDLLLVHGDEAFMPLETSFSRVNDLLCPVHYTGYVVQNSFLSPPASPPTSPSILASVGGGRFGHELLEAVAQASEILAKKIPHHIQMFTGPFSPDDVLHRMQAIANQGQNLSVERYTPHFLSYMQQAELSISMAGYNTTMNVLQTGVRSMLLPFTGNDDQEQSLRSHRLEELGIVSVIQREDLEPKRFAQKVIDCLQQQPQPITFDMQGVEKTAQYIKALTTSVAIAA
jgi:predicted glycosyltransferase